MSWPPSPAVTLWELGRLQSAVKSVAPLLNADVSVYSLVAYSGQHLTMHFILCSLFQNICFHVFFSGFCFGSWETSLQVQYHHLVERTGAAGSCLGEQHYVLFINPVTLNEWNRWLRTLYEDFTSRFLSIIICLLAINISLLSSSYLLSRSVHDCLLAFYSECPVHLGVCL